jgi:hypothetical protein
LCHKAAATQDAEGRLLERPTLFHHQEEELRLDRQAQDESVMQDLLAYDARNAREEEQMRLSVARLEAGRTQAEERKLAKLREREQKQDLRAQQDEQRRKDRMARTHLLCKLCYAVRPLPRRRRLRRPGFFAFTKGMPIMLQQNTNTYAGLVNGMRGTAEVVILDAGVEGMHMVTFLVCLIC